MKDVSVSYVATNLYCSSILDCREPPEFSGPLGFIPRAVLWPLSRLRQGDIPELECSTVITVCRSGQRSREAARILEQHGYTAYSMAGGMIEWNNQGNEVAHTRVS